MTTPSCSPFIPAGTYQESLSYGTVIQVTLTASCKNESGQFVQSTLKYNSGGLSGYDDISNNNGSLSLLSGSDSAINTENPYVPAGSYQNTSSNIQITLAATCNNENGDAIPSSIAYTEQQAKKFSDVMNNNGILESITSSSISLPTVSDSSVGDDDDDDADGDDADGDGDGDAAADGGDDAAADAGGDAAADGGADAAAAGGADVAGDTAAAAGGADAAADASAAAAALCA